MTRFLRSFALIVLLAVTASPARAEDSMIPERVMGKADAPVMVEEYVSLTCSHCAEFYNTTLPNLEKDYVDTGKVKFILRDFPLDNVGLKAAALARCMPADEYYPYIKILYKNQAVWAVAKDPETALIQYAQLGGLSGNKAKACLNDTKMQDAIIAERKDAGDKLGIQATPTFLINGKETIQGAQSETTFREKFDSLLNVQH